MVKDTKLAHTVHKFHCCETLKESSQRIAIHFLEIPKGIEGVQDKELQMWLNYFGSKHFEQEKYMIANTNTTFKKAVDEYDKFVSNDDFVSEYEKRQVFLYGQRIMLAKEFEKGEKQGIEKGIEQGIEQVAKNLLKQGLTVEQIAKGTGLDKNVIENLNKTNVLNDDFVSAYEKRQVFLYGQKIMLNREFELGEEKAKLEIAKNLLNQGLTVEEIAKDTGLSEKEIKSIPSS